MTEELKNIKEDIPCFSAKYKKAENIKILEPELWYLDRNRLIQSVINGLSCQTTSSFKKCIALEQLYSQSGASFVAPFSFTTNTVILSTT